MDCVHWGEGNNLTFLLLYDAEECSIRTPAPALQIFSEAHNSSWLDITRQAQGPVKFDCVRGEFMEAWWVMF